MRKRKFTWQSWDFDCEGDSYIIAKAECPDVELVPEYICREDNLHTDCMAGISKDIEEGWARYQVRSDWEDHEGEATGGYYITCFESETLRQGKRIGGWFPVWIVRKGDWY